MISVIVPVYNGEKTIESCIKSLQNQSCPNETYEIIVVDDGSTDSSPNILEGLGIRFITQPNRGPATARNRGAQIAKGNILLFTDADCVADKRWIEEMVRPFSNPEIVGVKGSYKTLQKELIARFAQAEFEERYRLQKRFEFIDFVDSYSAGFRKDVFFEIGGFDESFPLPDHEDVDLSYRLSRAGKKMVFNPKAFIYHQHPNSLIRYLRIKFRRAFWRMVVYKRYPEKILKDTYTPPNLKFQVLFFYCIIFSFLGAFFSYYFVCIFIIALLLFFFTTINFTLIILKDDMRVGLLAPVFLFLRASALGFGIIYGVVFWKNRIT
ncbi:MAG: glycosyltransferase [Candidatus Scalinduaceae bacterium]